MKQLLFIFLLPLYLILPTFAQSKLQQELKDSQQVQLGLYFYPSTLRMLNIQRDTAYDNMVKGVEKLSLLMLHPRKFTTKDFYQATNRLVEVEKYEEYIIWEGEDFELQVLGKPKEQEMLGLANYGGQYFFFDLKGTINLIELPNLYKNISMQDSTLQNGFQNIFNMIQNSEADFNRQEQRRKERAEQRRKEEEEKVKIKQDSLNLTNQ